MFSEPFHPLLLAKVIHREDSRVGKWTSLLNGMSYEVTLQNQGYKEGWRIETIFALTSTVSCAQHRVIPNKQKSPCLEQRKVYCGAMQEDGWLMPSKALSLPKEFGKVLLKVRLRGCGLRVCDQLMHKSLTV